MKEEKVILIVNPGSTSLKFKVYHFPDETILASGKVDRIGCEKSEYRFHLADRELKAQHPIPDYRTGIELILEALVGQESVLLSLDDLAAVGFKTVHAGSLSFGPGAIFLTDEVLQEMERFEIAAPVHNRVYLDVIECFREAAPDLPLAGLFEPTFHASITEEKYTCGVPYEWREQFGIRRYGFHGASHRYISETAPDLMGWNEAKRLTNGLVSCHLGGSSSLCAIRNGQSVDTTMEFSPQSGMVHSSRCETIDPFILLYAQREMGLSPDDLIRILCKESGLKGISGVSGDMRD